MSRIGKLPINIPIGVEVSIIDSSITVKGPKGSLVREFTRDVSITHVDGKIFVSPAHDSKRAKAMWGTFRSLINGMIIGVSEGFRKELEVNGVGYRASVKDNYLNLILGKSHNTKIEIPDVIKVTAPKQSIVVVESINKEKLGQFIATVIKQRPPEPYKGKGIKLFGQYVHRKEGKKS